MALEAQGSLSAESILIVENPTVDGYCTVQEGRLDMDEWNLSRRPAVAHIHRSFSTRI